MPHPAVLILFAILAAGVTIALVAEFGGLGLLGPAALLLALALRARRG